MGALDRSSERIVAHAGQSVHKIQPAGTPPNGAMGMCFIQRADTGEFIGQVWESSLKPTGRWAVRRDLAGEARDRAPHARRTGRPGPVQRRAHNAQSARGPRDDLR